MKVTILTEGGLEKGFGHITRCLSLCETFKEKGLNPEFIINGNKSIEGFLKGKRYKIFDWLKNKERLPLLLKNKDIVIIDSYLASADVYKKIAGLARLSVYIDDNNRIDYPCGIVINGGIHAKNIIYKKNKGIKYLLGPGYTLLRKEFRKVPEKKIRENIENIMVTFGGCDTVNMTPAVLKLIVRAYPEAAKDVIIGWGFRNIEGIKKVKDKKTRLVFCPGAGAVRDIMLKSDIAVSGGGQTIYELARIGVPSIIISVADNQLNETKECERRGLIDYAGWHRDAKVFKRLPVFLNRLRSYKARLKKMKHCRKLIDGHGPIRIIDFLINEAL